MNQLVLIDEELWAATRSGARAGRGFRYQDAVAAQLVVEAWAGLAPWTAVVPEGVEDVTLHGSSVEYWVQVKSRHDPRALFSVAEASRFLAKVIMGAPHSHTNVHYGLVLERPVDGLEATGWSKVLSDSKQATDRLIEPLSEALGGVGSGEVRAVLSRSHLVVEPQPLDHTVLNVEKKAGVVRAIARLIAVQLRQEAGERADSNVSARPGLPARIDVARVQARVDEVLSLVDPMAVDEAIRTGLCEAVDFERRVESAAFYSGVSVVPGHVSAGLVFERPEHTVAVLEALEHRRAVLVAGPSGAGKSALAWLAAYATRHAVRWYRVRKVEARDVATFVRHARALEAKLERPVGFVVDDVGRDSSSGWDELVREIAGEPGILAIGAVREEDVFTLSTASELPIVRPALDEPLAMRIWNALSAEKASRFPHWREAMELSNGLLLEYTHILTKGERLGLTVAEQVRRRLVEGRDDELMVLRPVAFAASYGAGVDASRLRKRRAMSEGQFARALRRLIDEHAVREEPDGALGGLHEIRSQYTDAALRNLMLVSTDQLLEETLDVLRAADFPTFIVRIMRRSPQLKDALFRGLTTRMKEERPRAWTSIMHGLGMATLDVAAERWVKIAREEGIEDRFATLAYNMALADTKLDVPHFERVNKAIDRFSKHCVEDARKEFWEALPKDLIAPRFELAEAHEFAAAMLSLKSSDPPLAVGIRVEVDGRNAPLLPFLDMLRTMRESNPAEAGGLVEDAGGVDHLLDRLFREVPWVTRPARRVEDGKCLVAANIRFVSDEVQPDVHADVLRLCELLLAADPQAEIVVANAIAADGEPLGFGDYKVATKRLEPRALPTTARVAWTRAALRAVQRLVGAPNQSERIAALATAVSELASRLEEVAESYCRGERPSAKWELFMQLNRYIFGLVPPPSIRDQRLGPLQKGEYAVGDPIQDFVSSLQDLVRALGAKQIEKPVLRAAETVDLLKTASELLEAEPWRWTDKHPVTPLKACIEMLPDLRQVLGYAAVAPQHVADLRRRLGRSTRARRALPRAAAAARDYAAAVVAKTRGKLEAALEKHGLAGHAFSRPVQKDDGFRWPAVEYCVVVRVETLVSFLTALPILEDVGAIFDGVGQIAFAPEMHGRVVPMAMRRIQSILPYDEFAQDWKEHLGAPILGAGQAAAFAAAFNDLLSISTIFTGRDRQPNEKELSYLEVVANRLASQVAVLTQAAKEHAAPDIAAAVSFLVDAFDRLQREQESDHWEGPTLAADFVGILSGRHTELSIGVVAHRINLLEWDLAYADRLVTRG